MEQSSFVMLPDMSVNDALDEIRTYLEYEGYSVERFCAFVKSRYKSYDKIGVTMTPSTGKVTIRRDPCKPFLDNYQLAMDGSWIAT